MDLDLPSDDEGLADSDVRCFDGTRLLGRSVPALQELVELPSDDDDDHDEGWSEDRLLTQSSAFS